MHAFGFFDGFDRDHVWMIERSDSTSFALEASEPLGIVGYFGRKNFEGDVTSEAGVGGAIHFAHSARTQGGVDSIMRERAAEQKGPQVLAKAGAILHQD